MNPNKEQLIKAIEAHRTGECHNCPFEHLYPCLDILCESTVNFINAITEENDKLYRLVDDKIQECEKWKGRLKIECEYTEKITVKKMQEMVKERASKAGNRYANGETVIIQYCISPEALDQIAKELLNESK